MPTGFTPSFGGSLIFGIAVESHVEDRPQTIQENTFFGLSGVEALAGGLHGRVANFRGVLFGDSAAGLAGAEDAFRSFNDGNAYVLVDTLGDGYPYAILRIFQPQGKVRQEAYGSFYRPYQAMFHILT